MATIALISVTDMQPVVDVPDTLPVKYVEPHIKAAQEQYIKPLLGDALYEQLETQKNAGTLTADNVALITAMTPLIIYRAYQVYLIFTGIKVTGMGLREYKEENSEPAPQPRRQAIQDYIRGQAESETAQVKSYLQANKDRYPLLESVCGYGTSYFSITKVQRRRRYRQRLGEGYTFRRNP